MRNIVFLLSFLLSACGAGPRHELTFSGRRAYGYAADFQEFAPRTPGSESHRQAAMWIKDTLQACGFQVEEQGFTYKGVQMLNLLATITGELNENTVLFGAHYDARVKADKDEAHPEKPVPGANDGASGVAVLLELACSTAETPEPIAFVFFDGEDSGGINGWEWIVGSRYFADHLTTYPGAVVIVDMVGDADLQIYYERNSDQELNRQIWQTARSLGYKSFLAEEKHAILDDHIPFINLGIPSVDLIDFDYPYYHTTEDTLDKISPDSLEQVGGTLQVWLMRQAPTR